MSVVSFKVDSLRNYSYSNDGADDKNLFGILLLEFLSKPKKHSFNILKGGKCSNVHKINEIIYDLIFKNSYSLGKPSREVRWSTGISIYSQKINTKTYLQWLINWFWRKFQRSPALHWIAVLPPSSYVEVLSPSKTVSGGRVFGR